jgi:hypothetical protein
MKQKTQNIELTNFTEAMYSARESAMETDAALRARCGRSGGRPSEGDRGPDDFARHAVGFTAWGTAVRLVAEAHQFVQPQVVLPLDDAVVTFEAESLRGSSAKGKRR